MSKPTVHYRGPAVRTAFNRAMLRPIDHPNHCPEHDVSNMNPALTSSVVSWDSITGRIETQHTIYVPEEEPPVLIDPVDKHHARLMELQPA